MTNYKKYKEALEKLGLRQLDVYRYKDKDVLRVQRIQDGKVLLVELPRRRDEISLDEYINYVKSKALQTK